jgi:hypothetical protein
LLPVAVTVVSKAMLGAIFLASRLRTRRYRGHVTRIR